MTVAEAQKLAEEGNVADAQSAYQHLLTEHPDDPVILHDLGMIFHRVGRLREAEELLSRSVGLDSSRLEFQTNHAVVLGSLGRHSEALGILDDVLKTCPNVGEAHTNRGVALDSLGLTAKATEAFRRGVELKPDDVGGLVYLAIHLRMSGRRREAAELLERAGVLSPDDPEVLRQLAALAADRGDARRQIELYGKVLATPWATSRDYSNLVSSMHYSPDFPREVFLQAATAWAGVNAEPLTVAAGRPMRDRNPARTLRVGYVSSDLRDHPVGRLLWPILEGHDRKSVRSFCYCDVSPGASDDLTLALAGQADEWREVFGMSDEQVREQILADEIDILVELSGHFGNHRLSLLARRCAPVQVSALGYCDTTGLTAVDYRITDALSDPLGSDRFHTEKLFRMENCCWCYKPWDQTPDVQLPPSARNGFVTFGILNNPVKTSDIAARTWAEILQRTPRSRLLLLAPSQTEADVVARFGKLGIGPDRLLMTGNAPRRTYLELYNRIDIVLDPFPFNGDNTTCDAFWMGVPVVALKGEAFWSRRGLSHLSAIGLVDLAASTIQDYVQIATKLAGNPNRRSQLRASLRGRLIYSPLGDQASSVSNLERAYRQMWHSWCDAGNDEHQNQGMA